MAMARRSKNSAALSNSAPQTARYRPTIQRMRRLDSVTIDGSEGGSNDGIAGRGCSGSAMGDTASSRADEAAASLLCLAARQEHAATRAAHHRLDRFLVARFAPGAAVAGSDHAQGEE